MIRDKENDERSCEERKKIKRNELILQPSSMEQLSLWGCSTPNTLIMSTSMGVIDPKFVKSGRKLKKTNIASFQET